MRRVKAVLSESPAKTRDETVVVKALLAESPPTAFHIMPTDVLSLMSQWCTPTCLINLGVTDKEVSTGPEMQGVICAGIHRSALHALEKRLQKLSPEICIGKLFPCGADVDSEGRPQAVLSGSIVIQAGLHSIWNSDVDVYCTFAHFDIMRRRLCDMGLRESKMCKNNEYKCGFVWARTFLEAFPNKMDRPVSPINEVFNYQLPGKHDVIVQLIVGTENIRDAREMLKTFDMTICQSHFDGKKFHFPEAFNTLNGFTKIRDTQFDAMKLWMHEEHKAKKQLVGKVMFLESNLSKIVCEIFFKVFNKFNKWVAYRSPELKPELDTVKQLHQALEKVFVRSVKYQKRGIRILNLPAGASKEEISRSFIYAWFMWKQVSRWRQERIRHERHVYFQWLESLRL